MFIGIIIIAYCILHIFLCIEAQYDDCGISVIIHQLLEDLQNGIKQTLIRSFCYVPDLPRTVV